VAQQPVFLVPTVVALCKGRPAGMRNRRLDVLFAGVDLGRDQWLRREQPGDAAFAQARECAGLVGQTDAAARGA
jgi:hypothetical protein